MAPMVPDTSHMTPRCINKRVDQTSGEIQEYQEYQWGPFVVRVYDNHFTLRGSIHFFWNYISSNQERNNYNQFGFNDFIWIVDYISKKLECSPEKMILKCYEYGLNLPTSFDPKVFGDTNLISHRNPPDRQMERNYDEKGQFIGFGRDRRMLKIYDKAKQCCINGNLLRVEVKIRKSIAHADIVTLQDLLKMSIWEKFREQLKQAVKDLVIIDNPEDHPKLSNPIYWRRLKRTATRKQRMNAFNNLPISTIKDEILTLIESTFNDLTGTNAHVLAVSQVGPPKIAKEQTPTNRCAFVPGRKFCPVTGYDISHQRPQSKFLSERSVKKLSAKQLIELRNIFLVRSKWNLTLEEQSYYIAHNIRNRGNRNKILVLC